MQGFAAVSSVVDDLKRQAAEIERLPGASEVFALLDLLRNPEEAINRIQQMQNICAEMGRVRDSLDASVARLAHLEALKLELDAREAAVTELEAKVKSIIAEAIQ